jgi:hypothetical protein
VNDLIGIWERNILFLDFSTSLSLRTIVQSAFGSSIHIRSYHPQVARRRLVPRVQLRPEVHRVDMVCGGDRLTRKLGYEVPTDRLVLLSKLLLQPLRVQP